MFQFWTSRSSLHRKSGLTESHTELRDNRLRTWDRRMSSTSDRSIRLACGCRGHTPFQEVAVAAARRMREPGRRLLSAPFSCVPMPAAIFTPLETFTYHDGWIRLTNM